MSKNWKKGSFKAGGSHQANDFSSCRGHGIVIGTCDAARERETSKELVNLLSDAIEEIYAQEEKEHRFKQQQQIEESHPHQESTASKSIQDLLKQEIEVIKQKKHSVTQNVISINTGVKGIALAKITRKDYCPLKLVNSIFEKVKRTKETYCRHVVRLIPLQFVFFPNEDELNDHSKMLIFKNLNLPYEMPKKKREISEDQEKELEDNKKPRLDVTDTVILDNINSENVECPQEIYESANDNSVLNNPEALISPENLDQTLLLVPEESGGNQHNDKFRYHVVFKARNHNVLTKDIVQRSILRNIYPYGKGDYRNPDVTILVEALKNLCGISWIESKILDEYPDFNIRKYQSEICKSN